MISKKNQLIPCFLIVLFLTFLSIVIHQPQVLAVETENTVTINIHRLILNSKDVKPVQNDGQTNPFGTSQEGMLTSYIGVNDIEYSVYDVTREFVELRQSGTTKEAAQEILSTEGVELSASPLEKQLTHRERNIDGLATFILPKKSKQEDAVYLFKETKRQDELSANNMVVVLPVFDPQGSALEVINLYPKTALPDEETLQIEKKVDRISATVGMVIPYQIETKVPKNIWSYENYKITDEAHQSLNLVKGTIRVSIDGKEISEIVETIEEKEHGFVLTLNPQKLAPYTNQRLVVEYQMQLSKNSQPDVAFTNKVSLETDHDKVEDHQKITTGGQRFKKVDSKNKKLGLAKAVFAILNEKGDYLIAENGGYRWETLNEKQALQNRNLVKLTSDIKGDFEM